MLDSNEQVKADNGYMSTFILLPVVLRLRFPRASHILFETMFTVRESM